MNVTFTQIPQNGASYLQPAIYEFEFDAASKDTLIRILSTEGEELGRKVLHGSHTSGRTDIAPYLRQSLSHEMPSAGDEATIIDTNCHRDVVVEVGGVESEPRTFIAAKIDLTQHVTLLTTQIDYRTMAYDEFDTIGFVNVDANPLEVVITAYDKASQTLSSKSLYTNVMMRQLALLITPKEFGSKVKRITAEFFAKGSSVGTIEYEIRSNLTTAQRIGWINEHHAAEYYTFPLRKSLLVEATRKRMESMWGREAAALESDNELKIISAYEPQKQTEALMKILSSPKIWLIRNGQPMAVELYTDRVLSAPCEGMGFVELDLRAAEKGEKLW